MDRPTISLNVEFAGLFDEFHQIERGEVAARVIDKHVFAAGIGGVDGADWGQVCQSLMVV